MPWIEKKAPEFYGGGLPAPCSCEAGYVCDACRGVICEFSTGRTPEEIMRDREELRRRDENDMWDDDDDRPF